VIPDIDLLAEKFLKSNSLFPDALINKSHLSLPKGAKRASALSALVTWRASRLWRKEVLRALPTQILTVAGDKDWENLLPEANLLGNLDYYGELSHFYQLSKVNLNITSAQMKGGLNQRVFDVPASGSFLLTDAKREATELFEPGKEIVTYHDPEEAKELALWYLERPSEREKISTAARKVVLQRHLYRHRLPVLVQTTLGGSP
jgi:spore maturation protein CgeB